MKRFGLRIGNTGIEFSSKDERDKALLCFTKGSTVGVNVGAGVRYKEEGDPAFGTYEREGSEVIVNCVVCQGQFSAGGCTKRDYPVKPYYGEKTWRTTENYICDGCFAKANADKELADAKAKVEAAGL